MLPFPRGDFLEGVAMSPSFITVVIDYRTRPDRVEPAFAELEALVRTVVATEPDCHGIRLLQDSADPARALLYEEWTSREAYLGPHLQTPHIQAFRAKASTLFAGPPDIQFWNLRADVLPSKG
jgi:quinol monooxygenase YgiN